MVTRLTAEDREDIRRAVEAAEQRTCAEIVPVVASRQDDYGAHRMGFAFGFSVIALSIVWLTFQRVEEGDWGVLALQVGLGETLAVLLLAFALALILASFVPVVMRPLIRFRTRIAACHRAAREAFAEYKLADTSQRKAVLIYVSLFEHVLVVIGDDEVDKVLKVEDWSAVCKATLTGVRQGDLKNGLLDGISQAAQVLERHFPPTDDDRNDLCDELRVRP
jgi:putative membrane protein